LFFCYTQQEETIKQQQTVQEQNMATLSVNGIDEVIITQLRTRAKNLNIDIDDLVQQFIRHGLKTLQVKKAPNIDSLFGIIPSTTDGIELQNEMREE
jgi:hypothetical protein